MRGCFLTGGGGVGVPGGCGLLIGREGELGCIEELLGRARSGCGAVAVLEGPAGIGKTALLAEAARQAGGYGFSVLRAAGGEMAVARSS